jgi:anthranilate phosphoribosyltransferase
VHGEPGWDEPTPAGPFVLYDVGPGTCRHSTRSAADYGLPACRPDDLRGGDAAHNAASLAAVFAGQDRGPHRDALVMGAALALEVTGLATDPRDGAARAAAAIDSGAAAGVVAALAAYSRSRT